MKNEIDFTYNWNNKLACLMALTTLRLRNDLKYRVGETYRITLKGRFLFYAEIRQIRHFFLTDINDYIAYVDSGYSADQCRQMMITMYKKRVSDWSRQQISFILLIKIKHDGKTKEHSHGGITVPSLYDFISGDPVRNNIPAHASV